MNFTALHYNEHLSQVRAAAANGRDRCTFGAIMYYLRRLSTDRPTARLRRRSSAAVKAARRRNRRERAKIITFSRKQCHR